MNAEAKKRFKEINFPFTCPISNREFKQAQGLSCYVTKTLKMNHSEYYDKFINHRNSECFFCGNKGEFISISRGYRNLCNNSECVKKSFSSHSIDGFMYRNNCNKEEATILFEKENQRQLEARTKTQSKLRKEDPLWDKKRSRNCVEFWTEKGYSKEHAILKAKEAMDDIHKKTSNKLKNNKEKYASKYPTKVEYYLERGFTLEYAKEKISEIQNRFSKEKCIEKYGEIEGTEIWLNRQEKWQNTLNKNGNLKGGYSEISQILFRAITNTYEIKELKDVYYWTKNKEIMIRSNSSIYLYDFADVSRMKIIEYNGDQYHANPGIYNENDYPHPYHKEKNYSAKDIWEKDMIKEQAAIKEGYQVLTIWDSEYRNNPSGTLQKCIDFLNS